MIDIGAIQHAFQGYRGGRLSVERIVGKGGMGTVFKATDSKLKRVCAIKVLNQNLLDNKPVIERFEREARIMIDIQHPSVVRVYDLDEIDGMPFIQLEWVDGGSLWDYVRNRGAFSPEMAVSVMMLVCDGITAAHEKGVIHRDIKPENILLGPDGHPKVTDFGIAMLETATRYTKDGVGMGTLGYMAPEQSLQAKDVDARADVHALGVTLWTILRGTEHLGLFFFHSIRTDPTLLSGIPDSLVEIIRRATEEQPDDRYASVSEMRFALKACWDAGIPGRSTEVFSAFGQTLGAGQLVLPTHPSIAREHTASVQISGMQSLMESPLLPNRTSGGTIRTPSRPNVDTVAETNGEQLPSRINSVPAVAPIAGRTRRRVGAVVGALVLAGLAAFILLRENASTPSSVTASPVASPVVAKPVASPVVAKLVEEPVVPLIGPQEAVVPEPPPERNPKKRAKTRKHKEDRQTAIREEAVTVHEAEQLPKPSDPVTVRVSVQGDARKVWLVGSSGRHALPATIQPGTYKVVGLFTAGEHVAISELRVSAGAPIKIVCADAMAKCKVK